MQLSLLELSVLEQIAQGANTIQKISKNLNRDKSRIYRAKQSLVNKDLIIFSNSTLSPQKKPIVTLLLQLLSDHPQLKTVLADSGIPTLILLLKKRTIPDIQKQSSYKKSIIYQKIKQAIHLSIIKKSNSSYQLNQKIWPNLVTFLKELNTYEKNIDPRVPVSSKIYYKTNDEILFSNKLDLDATKTAFSVYENYGIRLLLPTNYYILPKQEVSLKNILIHSLILTEIDNSIRNITNLSLFYLKHKQHLQPIHHPIIKNIKKILEGKTIKGYPTKEGIKEKAEIYDIKI